nr:MAG TPA: hypothetical protein [Caudoviricetes sp.]DAU54224.1 MAG TPA: hypothetical protein [Bacteriophage sp.]
MSVFVSFSFIAGKISSFNFCDFSDNFLNLLKFFLYFFAVSLPLLRGF